MGSCNRSRNAKLPQDVGSVPVFTLDRSMRMIAVSSFNWVIITYLEYLSWEIQWHYCMGQILMYKCIIVQSPEPNQSWLLSIVKNVSKILSNNHALEAGIFSDYTSTHIGLLLRYIYYLNNKSSHLPIFITSSRFRSFCSCGVSPPTRGYQSPAS